MSKYLEEQRRLAGITGNLDEAVASIHENKEIRKVSLTAAIQLEKALKAKGVNVTDRLRTDGWGHTPMIIAHEDMRLPLSVGVQNHPKTGGYQLFVEVQSQLFSAPNKARQEAVLQKILRGFQSIASKFSDLGIASVPLNEKGWPRLWVEVPADKLGEAQRDFPKRMGPVAVAITNGFRK